MIRLEPRLNYVRYMHIIYFHIMFVILNVMYVVQYINVLGDELNKL